MSTNLLCLKCPFFHPPGTPCPPGWHEVEAIGGDSQANDLFWRDMAPVFALMAVVGLLIIGFAFLHRGVL